MATVKFKVDLKDSAYLAANPTKVLQDNEVIFLDDGRYAFGDGSTTLAALTFFGGGTEQATGLVDGGTITVGTFGGSGSNNDIRVAAAEWYISGFGTFVTTTNNDFLDIALPSAGTQRYVGLFGKNDGTIIKSEGTEAALASLPATPANHAPIGYVLVTDASVSSTPDLSGYLLKADKATQSTNQTGTNGTTYVTPLANAIKANLASPAFTGTPTAPTASVGTNTTQLATTAFVLANAGSTDRVAIAVGWQNVTSPADSTTYYFGSLYVQQLFNTDGTVGRTLHAPITGNIIGFDFIMNATAGGSETSTLKVFNKTAGTNATITTTFAVNGQVARSYRGFTLAATLGDEIGLRWETPAWVTNPTTTQLSGVLIFST